MINHGGKRDGAGRPPKYTRTGKRVDVYLPEHQIAWLREENNMSAKIQKVIENEMEGNQARDRIDEMEFTAHELDFIWADWSNWDEHIAWLLTASRVEIADWIAAGQ